MALAASKSSIAWSTPTTAVWAIPNTRSGCLGAHLGEPAVVGLHAGVLVLGVTVHEQAHADRRVDQLAADAVLVLDGDARVRVEGGRLISSKLYRRGLAERSAAECRRREQPDRDRVGSCPSMT